MNRQMYLKLWLWKTVKSSPLINGGFQIIKGFQILFYSSYLLYSSYLRVFNQVFLRRKSILAFVSLVCPKYVRVVLFSFVFLMDVGCTRSPSDSLDEVKPPILLEDPSKSPDPVGEPLSKDPSSALSPTDVPGESPNLVGELLAESPSGPPSPVASPSDSSSATGQEQTASVLGSENGSTTVALSSPSAVKEEEIGGVVQDETEGEVASVTPSSDEKIVCAFSDILKKAIESRLNKNCSLVTTDEVSKMKTLRVENIKQESVEEIFDEGSIALFSSLEELDISGNPEMTSLPRFVFKFPGLKKLNVSNTGISNFGQELCHHLQDLTTLKASYNSYEGNEMPLAIVCLSNLTELDLSYSSLRYIDEYIWYLKKLEKLYLRGNILMNLPVMLPLMPSLLLLDLRDNQFEYESINSFKDCSQLAKGSDEQKECQEDLSEIVDCEYWYELPFERGAMGNQSFQARYTEMTGEEYQERSECIECAECYHSWINNYVFYGNPDDPKEDPEQDPLALKQKQAYLLDLTINGKTIREWRLALDGLAIVANENWFEWSCQYHIKGISMRNGILKSMYHWFFPRNTDYGPDNSETHPERYRSPDWSHPETCKPINYNTPLPSQKMGPWSEALPAVQSFIEDKYLEPGWDHCENWPTSICPDWQERMERGEDYGGGTVNKWWKRVFDIDGK